MIKCLSGFLLWVILILPSGLMAVDLVDLKDRPITQLELEEVIQEFILFGEIDELDRWKTVYPNAFTNVDLSEAYYEVGVDYYDKMFYKIAMKAFLKGYTVFSESEYKAGCAYYLARILYIDGDTERALYYINRAINRMDIGSQWWILADRMKKRISWEYISTSDGMPDDSISCVEFDGDDVWIGMWAGGVGRFSRSAYTIDLFNTNTSEIASQFVRDVCVIDNTVWVGTFDGLCKFDKRTDAFSRVIYQNLKYASVKKMRRYGDYLYVAALWKGIYRMNINTETWELFFSSSKNVTDIYETNEIIYIATLNDGLFIYEDGEFEQMLEDYPIKTICRVKNTIWVGTYGDGLLILDANTHELLQVITEGMGLSSDYIEEIKVVEELVIIGTLGGGVTFYDFEDKSFSYYGILDGLPSLDIVTVEVEGNNIWFGTLSGGLGILLTEEFSNMK